MTKRHSLILLAAIIALGIGSRFIHTGWILFDKYLGDALYAAMFYLLIGLIKDSPAKTKIMGTMVLMTTIECFQLTLIPARLVLSDSLILKGIAVLLGPQFAWGDLLAYAIGIGMIAAVERLLAHKR